MRCATARFVAPEPVRYEASASVNPAGAVYAVDSPEDARSVMAQIATRVPVLVTDGGSVVAVHATSAAVTAFAPRSRVIAPDARFCDPSVRVRVPDSAAVSVLVQTCT